MRSMDEDENEITEHQLEVFELVTNGGDFCPQCRSEGGQYMVIENPGEEWTQVHCAYGCGYLNLDDYYDSEKQRRDSEKRFRNVGRTW